MSAMLVAPEASFASMMQFVSRRHSYTAACYPNANLGTPECRIRFVLDHTLLHLQKAIGEIATEREEYDHGRMMQVLTMRVVTVKLFVTLLIFAGELGVTPEHIVETLAADCNEGYFGPSLLMRNEYSEGSWTVASSPVRMQAGAVMYRLTHLTILVGKLVEKRLVEPREMIRRILRADPQEDNTRHLVIAMLAQTCSLAHALDMTMEDIAALIPHVL